jgi:hypothetical protein
VCSDLSQKGARSHSSAPQTQFQAVQADTADSSVEAKFVAQSREFLEVCLSHFNRFALQSRLKLFQNLGRNLRVNGVLSRQRICCEFRANLAEL